MKSDSNITIKEVMNSDGLKKFVMFPHTLYKDSKYWVAPIIKEELEVLNKERIKELYPVVKNEDLVGGVYMPKDGQADPVGVTNVLAKAAKMLGVKIFEKSPVKKILVKNKRICGVETIQGKIDCEYVVLASGMWSRQIGEDIGAVSYTHLTLPTNREV